MHTSKSMPCSRRFLSGEKLIAEMVDVPNPDKIADLIMSRLRATTATSFALLGMPLSRIKHNQTVVRFVVNFIQYSSQHVTFTRVCPLSVMSTNRSSRCACLN